MATPFSITNDSATIGTSEYSLPADGTTLTAQTDDCFLQAYIDFSALTATERYEVKFYETVNGGSQIPTDVWTVDGVQGMLWVLPTRMVGNGWNITVKKIAGTDRSIGWAIFRDVGDRNALTIGANALTAAATATDFGTEIAAAVWAAVSETGESFADAIRVIVAVLVGKATLDSSGSFAYRDKADTKDRVAGTVVDTARTLTTRDGT